MSVNLKILNGSQFLVLPKIILGIPVNKCVNNVVLENGNIFEIQNLKNPVVLLPPKIYIQISQIQHKQNQIVTRNQNSLKITTENGTILITENAESDSNKTDDPPNPDEAETDKSDMLSEVQNTDESIDVDDPPNPNLSACFASQTVLESLANEEIEKASNLDKSGHEKDCIDLPPTKRVVQKQKTPTTKVPKTLPKMVVCEVCSKKIKRCNYKDHLKMHLGVKDYVCSICNKAFGWKSSYESHMSVHRTGKLFKCSLCEKCYSYQSGLYTHLINVHNSQAANERHKCDQCDKEFLRKETLREHIRNKHEDAKSWICEICGNKLCTINGLRAHMRDVHKKTPQQCDICQKWLTSVQMLKIHHKRKHSGLCPKKYQCITCGKLYPTLTRLKEHEIMHTDARPYKCKDCDRTFRSRTNLVGHQNTHLGIKPNKCPFCPKTFTFNCNKIKHMKRHGNNRPHKCSYCQKSFFESQELRKHMICHQKTDSEAKRTNQVLKNMRAPNQYQEQLQSPHEPEPYYANYI